jgi:hypothetical protein
VIGYADVDAGDGSGERIMSKITELDSAGIAKARRRGIVSSRNDAKAVRYHAAADTVRITLKNGTDVLIPRTKMDGLRGLPRFAARKLKVDFGGEALSIEQYDVHISVGGLIRKAVMGDDPFARAGRTRSAAKANAARANGLRGGRPPSAA